MRRFLKSVASLFLIATLSHAALLPTSLNIWIQSENMRHIVKWSSVQETCSSVNYTVKYQGEFEYMLNTWLDAHACMQIVQTECDLTFDLGSDSDYNIRVLAQCGDWEVWSQLPKTFNRRDTVLLAPDMSVKSSEGGIDVYFSEIPTHFNVKVKIWKEGNEENATINAITNQQFHHVVRLENGGKYCVIAEITLDTGNRSNSTTAQCVIVQDPGPSWLVPLVAVVLTLALALTLGLITSRCSQWLRRFVHKKEPLPNSLLGWTKSTPIFTSKALLERTHSVFLLDPTERMPETREEMK